MLDLDLARPSWAWWLAVLAILVVGAVRACDYVDTILNGPDTRDPTASERAELRALGPLTFAAAPGGVYVARGDGSRPRALVPGASPAWSPDGRRLAYESEEGVWVMDADGRSTRRVVDFGFDPAWSPDGRQLAFDTGNQIVVVNVRTGRTRMLTGAGSEPVWSPDSRSIAFVSHRDGLVSEGGFVEAPIDQLYVMGADGGDQRRLSRTETDDAHPAWSPDGGRIAFSTSSDEWLTTKQGIVVVDADGGGTRRRYVAATDTEPAWSPDGRWLVMVCDVAQSMLCFARSDGEGPLLRRPLNPGNVTFGDPRRRWNLASPAWRPTPAR